MGLSVSREDGVDRIRMEGWCGLWVWFGKAVVWLGMGSGVG